MNQSEIDNLKHQRDQALLMEASHRWLTCIGFFLALIGGMAFGFGAGYQMGSDAAGEPVEEFESLWDRGEPVQGDGATEAIEARIR